MKKIIIKQQKSNDIALGKSCNLNSSYTIFGNEDVHVMDPEGNTLGILF